MRRLFALIYLFILITTTFLLYIPIPEAQAINSAYTPATVVIGQAGFGACDGGINQGDFQRGLYTPYESMTSNGKLFIADRNDHRILIYNSIPTSNNPIPDVVVGQPNLCGIVGNNGGLSARSLYTPSGVYSDGVKLFIADYGNSRVLIYNTIPTSNGAAADVVIGQPDMISSTGNNGGLSASSLYRPMGVYSDGTRLFIGDYMNNRVLIYNTIPTSNGVAADVVIGQPNMTSNTANNGGLGASSLYRPMGVYYNSTRLFVADTANNRVLIYNTIPTSNGAAADVVVGQPDMTSGIVNNGGLSASTLNYPYRVSFDSTHLFITDSSNNRVLIYNTIPTSNGTSADIVIGQSDMVSGTANNGGLSANTLNYPYGGIYSDGTRLFITDSGNHRVLIYNSIPTSNGVAADIVVGQPDFTSSSSNQPGTVGANTLNRPFGVFSDGTQLFIADTFNHRVLIYNSVPTSSNMVADVVIGQSNMNSNSANQGGSIAANTLKNPYMIYSDGIKLFISDAENHRVLVFNTIPTSNNAAADIVIGQPDMISGTANNGGRNANTLNTPDSIYSDGTRLLISDRLNFRVLIYNTIPTSNNAAADIVIGQPNMTSGTMNYGGRSARSLENPMEITLVDNKLVLVDDNNTNRVLIYNSIPTENYTAADIVIGQPNMSSGTNNYGGISARSLFAPYGVCSDGSRLFISDTWNSRILGFNSLPMENFAAADIVIGQPNMTSGTKNYEGVSSRSLNFPSRIYINNMRLFVTDTSNNRVLIYPLGPQGTSLTAPRYTTSLINTLTLAADDAKEMMISEDAAFSGASWESFSTSKDMIPFIEEGTKTVYAKFKDYMNYEGEVLSVQITYDVTAPTGTISINSDETITNTDEVTLTLSATDNLSEVSKMMVSNKIDYSGGTWETYNTSKEWRLSMGDGEKRVYVKYRDEVGNISESYEDSIEMDMGAPTGTLIINEGEEYTSSREVVLHITGEDEVTGVEEMRISEDRTMEGVEWEGYETSREYTLSEGDGYKVIYIQYRDGIGNESEVYGSNITLDSNTEIEVTEIGEEEVEGEIENWETEETTPTFTGEGEVGATITIEIEGIETGTVVVNEDGVWSWTPSIELTRGQEYNLTITSTDLAGNEDIQTFTLGISDEEVINVNQTTPEAQITTIQLPNTGVMIIVGLMVMGGLLWTGVNFKVILKLKKR